MEPEADTKNVASVTRFFFALPQSMLGSTPLLFSGELSEYHAQRISAAELPATLTERRVEVTRWLDGDSEAPDAGVDAGSVERKLVIASPNRRLEPGQTYTWAIPGFGVVATFKVAPDETPFLRRYWPLVSAGFFGHAVYCSGTPHHLRAQRITLAPITRSADVELGVGLTKIDAERCVSWELDPNEIPPVMLPPPVLGQTNVDPTPLRRAASSVEGEPQVCEAAAQQIGPGCALVFDDRFVVFPPPNGALWIFEGEEIAFHTVTRGGAFVVKGLKPEHSSSLDYLVEIESGETYTGKALVRSSRVTTHVVINEVMANPKGSEPAQEWVELYNDGTTAVDLAGFSLEDGSSEVELPRHVLPPATYTLVVNTGFAENSGVDIPILPDAALIRVPQLFRSGISNSGETLVLRAPEGAVVSRFAAMASTTPGTSLARRSPESVDEGNESFAFHGEPGASPGAPNVVAESISP
jgi:hypothetical protein